MIHAQMATLTIHKQMRQYDDLLYITLAHHITFFRRLFAVLFSTRSHLL